MRPDPSKSNATGSPEQQAAHQASQKPTRDDVHEQREASQQQEGVVKPAARPPAQSEIDKDRADWEGMAQKPSSPDDVPPKGAGAPTPGANSLAGRKG